MHGKLLDFFSEVEWAVALRKRSKSDIIGDKETPFLVQVQKNGRSFWVADPFLFDYDGRTLLSAEYYHKKAKKASLHILRLEKDI